MRFKGTWIRRNTVEPRLACVWIIMIALTLTILSTCKQRAERGDEWGDAICIVKIKKGLTEGAKAAVSRSLHAQLPMEVNRQIAPNALQH